MSRPVHPAERATIARCACTALLIGSMDFSRLGPAVAGGSAGRSSPGRRRGELDGRSRRIAGEHRPAGVARPSERCTSGAPATVGARPGIPPSGRPAGRPLGNNVIYVYAIPLDSPREGAWRRVERLRGGIGPVLEEPPRQGQHWKCRADFTERELLVPVPSEVRSRASTALVLPAPAGGLRAPD